MQRLPLVFFSAARAVWETKLDPGNETQKPTLVAKHRSNQLSFALTSGRKVAPWTAGWGALGVRVWDVEMGRRNKFWLAFASNGRRVTRSSGKYLFGRCDQGDMADADSCRLASSKQHNEKPGSSANIA
jgi:hypothetical protein